MYRTHTTTYILLGRIHITERIHTTYIPQRPNAYILRRVYILRLLYIHVDRIHLVLRDEYTKLYMQRVIKCYACTWYTIGTLLYTFNHSRPLRRRQARGRSGTRRPNARPWQAPPSVLPPISALCVADADGVDRSQSGCGVRVWGAEEGRAGDRGTNWGRLRGMVETERHGDTAGMPAMAAGVGLAADPGLRVASSGLGCLLSGSGRWDDGGGLRLERPLGM
jgi:hypothetical protein